MSGDLETTAALARALPKAELHVHLEGCLEAELLFALAKRNDVAIPWPSIEDLRRAYRYDDLQSFLDLFFAGCRVLCRREDFFDVTRAYLARAHADGVVRAEVFLGPQAFTDRGIAVSDILGGTLDAMAEAEQEVGISTGLIVSCNRQRAEAEAFAQLEQVLAFGERIAGFGLGGAERGNPPEKFASYFAELRRLGFRTCAHAGEEGPADNVRAALEVLGVDRIDHGVHAADDPVLLAELAAARVPLTMCPISNVKLRVVDALEDHPLAALLSAGLNVSVHSDDPAYFGGYVLDNLLGCARALGLGPRELKTLAANSIEASFLDGDDKAPLLAAIAELAA